MTMLISSSHLAVATDLAEALRWRHDHPDATVIAGGTEVLADVALQQHRPQGFLHIGRIPSLQTVTISDETIVLGAATTIERLTNPDLAAASPLLAQVGASIGTPQSRRRGTDDSAPPQHPAGSATPPAGEPHPSLPQALPGARRGGDDR